MAKTGWIIGVDEAGRGPLAGPVCVAAVAVQRKYLPQIEKLGIRDSKKLSPKKREEWIEWMTQKEKKVFFSASFSSHKRIDSVGITKAVSESLGRSIGKLGVRPAETDVFLDGLLFAPKKFLRQETIIRGDEKHEVIALASIIAKVKRDRYMHRQSKKFREYGFERHVGYGTREHREKIQKYGLCEIHRRSYCQNLII